MKLTEIIKAIAHSDGSRRVVFDGKNVGKTSAACIYVLFLLLPVIEFVLIFKTPFYAKVGHVTAIVAYIVFLSIVMILIYVITKRHNSKVVKSLEPHWLEHFDSPALEEVVYNKTAVYRDFFKHLKQAGLPQSEEQIYSALKRIFQNLEEENSDLLSAIKQRTKQEGK